MPNQSESDQTVRRCSITGLDHTIENALVIGVIIGKRQSRVFQNSDSTKDGGNSSRAVWNITLRDSIADFMNVTVWGSVEYILSLEQNFFVGNVVEIEKPRVNLCRVEDSNAAYSPSVTSSYYLTCSEAFSVIRHYEAADFARFASLANRPTKPLENLVPLVDIERNVISFQGDYIDLLVVIQKLSEIRKYVKDDGEKQVRDLIVFDQTNYNFLVTLWDEDLIKRSLKWKAKETILFLADAKVSMNSFRKCATVSITSKTLIIEDPMCQQASSLKTYAAEATFERVGKLTEISNIESLPITNIMNIRQIQEKITETLNGNFLDISNRIITASTYSIVTDFDLDGSLKTTRSECSRCKTVLFNTQLCENLDCVTEKSIIEISYDIRMTISDHSGSLRNCRLSGFRAETILGCKIDRFLKMMQLEKTELKWKFLMERCLVQLVIMCHASGPLVMVVGCKVADIGKYINNLPI